MAYMNQEKKAVIKANLDNVLKPLGIKFSLKVRHHMSISLTLKSGPVDFIGDYAKANGETTPAWVITTNHMSINRYWFQDHFSKPVADIIAKIVKALETADYYDRSDAMVDYFDTAYYMDIDVGQWDKPYVYSK